MVLERIGACDSSRRINRSESVSAALGLLTLLPKPRMVPWAGFLILNHRSSRLQRPSQGSLLDPLWIATIFALLDTRCHPFNRPVDNVGRAAVCLFAPVDHPQPNSMISTAYFHTIWAWSSVYHFRNVVVKLERSNLSLVFEFNRVPPTSQSRLRSPPSRMASGIQQINFSSAMSLQC